ncbi:MAG: hypothetical protein JXA15_12100 [Spirochaetales bacterium]|nr:hypothetical protein [Spirochaetales bacterium]
MPVKRLAAAVAALAFAFTASAAKIDSLSAACVAFVARHDALTAGLFLRQEFFRRDPALLAELMGSGHDFTASMRERLGGLIDDEFGETMAALEAEAARLPDAAERAYARALLAFDRYKIEFDLKKDKRSSLPHLEEADLLAREALRSKRRIADFHRLQGEIYNQFIPLKGGVSAIYFSTEAKKSYLAGLAIRKDHPHTLVLLGVWNLFAPEIAGGSKTRALDLFRDARRTPADDYPTFLSHLWESLAYSDLLRRPEAIEAIKRALAIAPENTWALWILAELEAGRRPLDVML